MSRSRVLLLLFLTASLIIYVKTHPVALIQGDIRKDPASEAPLNRTRRWEYHWSSGDGDHGCNCEDNGEYHHNNGMVWHNYPDGSYSYHYSYG